MQRHAPHCPPLATISDTASQSGNQSVSHHDKTKQPPKEPYSLTWRHTDRQSRNDARHRRPNLPNTHTLINPPSSSLAHRTRLRACVGGAVCVCVSRVPFAESDGPRASNAPTLPYPAHRRWPRHAIQRARPHPSAARLVPEKQWQQITMSMRGIGDHSIGEHQSNNRHTRLTHTYTYTHSLYLSISLSISLYLSFSHIHTYTTTLNRPPPCHPDAHTKRWVVQVR